MPVGVLSPSIKLDGAPLSAELMGDLVELRVDLTASAPAQTTLRFTDWTGERATGSALHLGTTLQISLPSIDEHQSSMVALPTMEITEVGVDAPEDGVGELVVVAHDPSHRLGLGSSVRSHLKSSADDIVRTLVQEHTALRYRTTGPTSFKAMKMPYFLRADSPLAALNELVARAGGAWWVDEDTLVVGEPGSRAQVELAYLQDLRSCSVRVSGRYPNDVVVSGWDHATMQRIVGQATTPKTVPAPIGGNRTNFPAETLTVAGARAFTTEEAKQLAKVLANRSASRRVDVRGVASCTPKLVPGGRVKVSGFPGANGTYDVQQVEHVFRPGGIFDTRFVAGSRDPLTVAGDLALGGPRASSIRFDGLVVGVVTNNSDPESLGRVKVKFPWLSDKEESDWARVASFGGGNQRGSTFVPEVSDEVLVGFEGGDLRKAVVLGSLHNGKNKVPAYQVKDGKVLARAITSRLGHVFEMADGDGDTNQHLLLKLADGKTRLRVGKDKVEVETPAGHPISLKSGQASITITDKGDITIAGNNITIKGEVNVKIEAKGGAEMKGATAKVEGQAQTTVKGAVTEISASGPAIVKGTPVQIN